MPLARFQVRSEYGLGQPELYREANREDPKAVLDGVAVAGLVGILRQLGDLAEFAAEVFHGLQEQVMATASRSHKLKVRVQNIEAALPPLEKAVLAQTSHIHFAYTAGSEWHPRLKNEQNLFIHSDLPRFIMDSYEECRDPPRLHLLDKFDSDGPGSCLKRYSDPTFFRKVSSNSKEHDEEKVLRDKKGRKIKKKRSSQRSKDLLRSASMPNHSGRMHFTQPIINGQTSPSHAASTIDMTLKPDLGDHSNSFDSKAGSGYSDCVFHRNSSAQPEEHESEKLPSRFVQHDHISDSAFHSGQSDKLPSRFVQHDHISDSASHGGQSEKLPSRFVQHDHASDSTFHSGQSDKLPSRFVQHDHISDSAFHGGQSEKLSSRFVQHDHTSDSAVHSGQSEKFPSKFVHHDYLSDSAFPGGQADAVGDSFVQNSSPEQIDPHSSCVSWDEKEEILEPRSQNCHGDEASVVLTTASDLDAWERMIPSHRSPDQMDIVFDGENTRKLSSSRNQLDDIESEPDYYVDALNTIESESETDLDCQTKQVEQVSSHFNNEQMEDRMDHAAADISCQHPSKDEFHIVSDIFSNKGMSCDLPNSVTSHSFNHQHASQISKDSDSGYSPGIAGPTSAEALDGLNGDSVQTDPSSNLDKSGPSNSFTHEETTHISGEFSNLDSAYRIEGSSKPDAFDGSKVDSVATEQPIKVSPRTDALDDSKVDSDVTEVTEQHIEGASPADALNSPEVEPLLTEPPTSLSGVSNLRPLENGTVSSFGKFQEIQVEFSGPHSMSFWTNGGLLGLQPSKPPDFAVSKTATQDLVTGSEVGALGPQNHSFMQRYSGEEGKAKGLGEDPGSTEGLSSSKCPPAWHEYQKAKVERGCDSQHGNRFNHVNGGEFSATSAMRQGNEPLVDANLKATSFEASQESNENSSQIFGLGHRFLINGFRRKLCLGADCKTELFSSQETSTLEQRSGNHGFSYQAAPEKALNEQFGHKIGIDSLPPSPPLEHMKISFRPLDSFEDSRLRLKIPDGNHCNGSIRDMFPSFQLVPEPGIQRHDVNSDSDDDTFCRSSPYMSDDCPSHQSELDSDQWDSGESSESKDNELYDSFLRVQPVESVPSSFCPGEMGNNGIHIESGIKGLCIRNSADPSLSTSTLDLPSFDAVNGLLQGEMKDKSNPLTQIESQYSGESTPFPPPLPPAEWRFAKAHSDVATGKADDIPKEHGQALDPKLLVSATCEQPKPIPANELLNNVGTIALKLNRMSSQQVKEHSNGQGMDEKEDFLHQIRAKSFSLRRTATSKPTLTTGPTANHRVNEILEKAIAIRKAVASDDGEDEDTWSDT